MYRNANARQTHFSHSTPDVNARVNSGFRRSTRIPAHAPRSPRPGRRAQIEGDNNGAVLNNGAPLRTPHSRSAVESRTLRSEKSAT
jgi:hypothetical protein